MKARAAALTVGIIGLCAVCFIFLTPAESVYFYNGTILTIDARDRVVGSVLVRDGRIAKIDNEITSEEKELATRVDLRGRVMLPGFVDAHGHFPGSGLSAAAVDLNSPPIGKITSMAQIKKALRNAAKDLSGDDWLVGFGYDDTLLEEKRHPTRSDLDQVVGDRPVFLMHISGHLAVLNSRALAVMNITAQTPDPAGGKLRRRKGSLEPNGVIEEGAVKPVATRAFDFPLLKKWCVLRQAVSDYAKVGVTTAQSGLVDAKLLRALYWASRVGLLPFRLIAWPDVAAGTSHLEGGIDLKSFNTRDFHTGAIKLIADGSIQGYTGYLSRPYATPFQGNQSYRGYPIYKPDELNQLVARLAKAGFQLAIHGNGDAAIDDILTAVSRGKVAPGTILIHSQMATTKQLETMRELGVSPSFFAAHTYYWGDRHYSTFLGRARAEKISPMRSADKLGLRYSIHLDTPVVPMDPLFAIWNAVHRTTSSGRVLGKSETISVERALRAVTIDAAWQMFLDDETGSIEPGKSADFVILSEDPRRNPGAIRSIEVIATIYRGEVIYAAADF